MKHHRHSCYTICMDVDKFVVELMELMSREAKAERLTEFEMSDGCQCLHCQFPVHLKLERGIRALSVHRDC